MVSPVELQGMRQAIMLSALGLGATSPNPPVGCVILDVDGRVVGEGYHQRKGESHAEAHALEAAGRRAKGGTALVTLEPCNHYGRTPPCHQALLDAGIARAVIAVIDPTSRGEGGVARLRKAGMDVQVGVLADEALLVLGSWLAGLRLSRPLVVWPYVLGAGEHRAALGSAPGVENLLWTVDAVLDDDGRAVEAVAGRHGAGALDLPAVFPGDPPTTLAALHAAGVRSVLLAVEPDAAVRFLTAGLVDRVVAYVAPRGPSSHPVETTSKGVGFLPPGFRVAEITRMEQHMRVVGVSDRTGDWQ